MSLVLHATAQRTLEQFIANPSHALLLVGQGGIGKKSVAEWLIGEVLHLPTDKLEGYAYYSRLSPDDKGTISIESVRGLLRFLQLRTVGSEPLRRAVLIEAAPAMTTEAQNAFLKILEEPPADTLLILTADMPQGLLPTILSRVQTATIQPPAEAAFTEHFSKQGHGPQVITQAYFLSGGLPGLGQALLTQEQSHPLVGGVQQAKELLRQTPYERLCKVDGLAKQKDSVRSILAALQRISQTGIKQASAKQDRARIVQWHRIHKVTQNAFEAIEKNGNTKLILDHLFLHL